MVNSARDISVYRSTTQVSCVVDSVDSGISAVVKVCLVPSQKGLLPQPVKQDADVIDGLFGMM